MCFPGATFAEALDNFTLNFFEPGKGKPGKGNNPVATINHAFEKPGPDDPVLDQTFLDPLNRQSRWSPALLDLFVNLVLRDEAYGRRLERHYELFKNVVDDPAGRSHAPRAARRRNRPT